MAQYESLKDYLSLNKKAEIIHKSNELLHANNSEAINRSLKDITILTLRCIEISSSTAMVFMDVTADIFDSVSNNVSLTYYCIMMTGDVNKGFSDMTVGAVTELAAEELQEENVLSMFGLPDISQDNIEKKAEWLYKGLYARIPRDPETKYCFDPVKVNQKYGIKMWPAEFEKDVLGQIRFTPSRADIYNIEDMSKCYYNEPIPANSILLNSDYYKEHSKRYDDILVATHELVHWNLHQLYFNIRRLLEGTFDIMNCSSEPIVFDESMSLTEKANWYAEWQANELAMRVTMPKHLIEEAIDEYENNISESHHVINSSLSHDGQYYKNMIYKLSWDFNVPPCLLRKRFRQLGYDFADGFRFDDEEDYSVFPSLSFIHGSLEENESFIIERSDFERMLRENKEFAELINDRICVYTGYVVCINNPKYIRYSIKNNKIEYDLSRYAIDHADECCLIFELYDTATPTKFFSYYNQTYLCCLIEKYKDIRFDKASNATISEQQHRMVSWLKHDKEEYDQMMKEGITTFSDALKYIMDNGIKLPENSEKSKKLTKKDLAEYLECDDKTIQNYRNGMIPDKIEKVMMICLACETGPNVSQFLIEKSIGGIPDIGIKKVAYEELLRHTDVRLSVWDDILHEFDLPPIRFKS